MIGIKLLNSKTLYACQRMKLQRGMNWKGETAINEQAAGETYLFLRLP